MKVHKSIHNTNPFLLCFTTKIAIFVFTLLTTTGASSAIAQPSLPILGLSTERERPDVLRVLFIGNSHTKLHGISTTLPKILEELAESRGKTLVHDRVTTPTRALEKHWEKGKAQEAISSGTWDYIVLQEKLPYTFENVNSMHNSIRLFTSYIRAEQPQAEILLYMTWHRADESWTWPAIEVAFSHIANELDLLVVPVGLAWFYHDQLSSEIRLRKNDKYSHARKEGAYLAACTFYASLYNDSPLDLPFVFNLREKRISSSGIYSLQQAAFWATSQ